MGSLTWQQYEAVKSALRDLLGLQRVECLGLGEKGRVRLSRKTTLLEIEAKGEQHGLDGRDLRHFI